ncbi:MAG: hypothetical protein M2R45_01325 [Verrucomicrobia subdivision 3 bacterium]|nr:hypothetical protein [Limisphaerales bacterium]MCS1415191.1 hypothetical protein [Limisphaerales bacterium]
MIHTGQVIRQFSLKDQSPQPILSSEHPFAHVPARNGWHVALALFKSPDGQLWRAHTSPIYLTVDDKSTAFKRDTLHRGRWIDKLIGITNQPNHYQRKADHDPIITTYHRAPRACPMPLLR